MLCTVKSLEAIPVLRLLQNALKHARYCKTTSEMIPPPIRTVELGGVNRTNRDTLTGHLSYSDPPLGCK